MPYETMWRLEPHTAAKHAILRRYLGAWFPKLALGGLRRLVFFDGFAGPGMYSGGEDGSPIIALKTLLDHTHFDKMGATEFVFLFNESDDARFARLEQVLDAFAADRGGLPANVRVVREHGHFATTSLEIVESLKARGARLAPTFAFVDPFGIDVPLEMLRQLLGFQRCELFVFFSQNFAVRFATFSKVDERLTALFGTDAYRGAAGLAGPERAAFLLNLYLTQLRDVCGSPMCCLSSLRPWTATGISSAMAPEASKVSAR